MYLHSSVRYTLKCVNKVVLSQSLQRLEAYRYYNGGIDVLSLRQNNVHKANIINVQRIIIDKIVTKFVC